MVASNIKEEGLYCPAIWDSLLCWPPARAGQVIHLPCPPLKGIDPTSKIEGKKVELYLLCTPEYVRYSARIEWAKRTCLEDGRWQVAPEAAGALLDHPPTAGTYVSQGWTDYNSCFLPEIRDLMKQLDAGTREEAEVTSSIHVIISFQAKKKCFLIITLVSRGKWRWLS